MQQRAQGSCHVSTPAGRQAAAAAALPQPLRAARAVAMECVRRRRRIQQPDEAWKHAMCQVLLVFRLSMSGG